MGVVEILGFFASVATIVSGLGWVLDRNSRKYQQIHEQSVTALTKVSEKMGKIEETLTGVRLDLPVNYVTKDELMLHIRGEERWHESVDRRLNDIHDELSSLREWRHR